MAATKARTAIWTSQTLTASAGNTTSSPVDLSAGYGAMLNFDLTNGGTGPTVAAQIQVQVANDWNAGSPTLWESLGTYIGSLTASAIASFSIEIPAGVAAVRLIAGSNTGQNVTANADISNITAL